MKRKIAKKKIAKKRPNLKNKVAPEKTKTVKSTTSSSDKALIKFDPLQRYLTEISNYKLLTREQEKELGTRFLPNTIRWISTVLLPFKNLITKAML